MIRADVHIRQVLIAFGPSQVPRETLETAAELAAALGAEVRALLVEERWLEQVAEHPATAELYLGSRTVRPWDRDTLRLQLRARAEQVRRAVSQLVEQRGVRVSFEVTRGDVATVLESAAGADVLTAFMAASRSSFPAGHRSSVELAHVLRHAGGFTLVHREGRLGRLPVVVYYDGSPAAARALAVVGALRGGRRDEVRVLVAFGDQDATAHLMAEIDSWRREHALRVVAHPVRSADPADSARTLLQFPRSLLVLPDGAPALRPGVVESLLDAASAVLVVRA
jgi:hypothetical protein